MNDERRQSVAQGSLGPALHWQGPGSRPNRLNGTGRRGLPRCHIGMLQRIFVRGIARPRAAGKGDYAAGKALIRLFSVEAAAGLASGLVARLHPPLRVQSVTLIPAKMPIGGAGLRLLVLVATGAWINGVFEATGENVPKVT